MNKFRQDRLVLLKALFGLVNEALDNSDINPYIEQDVAEFLTEIKDKRHKRNLKIIRRELDRWINECEEHRKNGKDLKNETIS
jgi:hypothetical protein